MQNKSYKAIIVAGNWTYFDQEVKPSGTMQKLAQALISSPIKFSTFDVKNGGYIGELEGIYETLGNYDIVFWFPNIDNDIPKMLPIKEKFQKIMLITSKNNRSNKYTFQELIQRALTTKSNLMVEVTEKEDKFSFRLFDPLMNVFYEGTDINELASNMINRLVYLMSITRQRTYQEPEDKSLVLKWYFDQFATKMEPCEGEAHLAVPPQTEFLNLVHEYADIFTSLMPPLCNQERFIGNCSLKPNPIIGRCSKSMPSFRHADLIFVSKRNIDKSQIELEHFVPVYEAKYDPKIANGETTILKYYGKDKPSVDTPIQVRLYKSLPNINYMIHSHCYVDDGDYTIIQTNTVNPCGAIEEANEILSAIDKTIGDRNLNRYVINLKGHGAIIMGNTVDDLRNISFKSRPTPEYV